MYPVETAADMGMVTETHRPIEELGQGEILINHLVRLGLCSVLQIGIERVMCSSSI